MGGIRGRFGWERSAARSWVKLQPLTSTPNLPPPQLPSALCLLPPAFTRYREYSCITSAIGMRDRALRVRGDR